MEAKTIISVEDFLKKVVEDTKNWDKANEAAHPWFRGQTNKDYKPLPSVFRPDGYDEINMTQLFRYRAGVFGEVPDRSGFIDEWLFLMQHYGLPTRMLDWTESGIIALFFSVHEQDRFDRIMGSDPQLSQGNLSKDGAIWMIHPLKLNALTKAVGEVFPNTWSDHLENRPVRANLQIPFGLKEATRDATQYPIAILTTFSKQVMGAQKSCFTVYGLLQDDLETMFFDKSLVKSGYFIKYVVPAEAKPTIRRELDVLGVSHSVVFPDFQHLAIELKERFRKRS